MQILLKNWVSKEDLRTGISKLEWFKLIAKRSLKGTKSEVGPYRIPIPMLSETGTGY